MKKHRIKYILAAVAIAVAVLTMISNNLLVISILTLTTIALALSLSRSLTLNLLRLMTPFVTFYLASSLIAQYFILHRVSMSCNVAVILKVLATSITAIIFVDTVISRLMVMGIFIPKILMYAILSLRILEYLTSSTSELRFIISRNYCLGDNLLNRAKVYMFMVKSLTLNATLKAIQLYESLIPRLSRLRTISS